MYVLFRAAEQETGSEAVSWSGEQALMLIWAMPVCGGHSSSVRGHPPTHAERICLNK